MLALCLPAVIGLIRGACNMKKPVSKHASKGGLARAESLTPEARSEIARAAAQARWGDGESLLPKETHTGVLKIKGRDIPCSVLENGSRVFSTRGINRAMGAKRTGAPEGARNGAPQLPGFLAASSLNRLFLMT